MIFRPSGQMVYHWTSERVWSEFLWYHNSLSFLVASKGWPTISLLLQPTHSHNNIDKKWQLYSYLTVTSALKGKKKTNKIGGGSWIIWPRLFIILGCFFEFLVCTWRHGGHVGEQNNSEKSLLGIWLYCYLKLERDFAAIVLYTKMSASSRECNPRLFIIF